MHAASQFAVESAIVTTLDRMRIVAERRVASAAIEVPIAAPIDPISDGKRRLIDACRVARRAHGSGVIVLGSGCG